MLQAGFQTVKKSLIILFRRTIQLWRVWRSHRLLNTLTLTPIPHAMRNVFSAVVTAKIDKLQPRLTFSLPRKVHETLNKL